ncbi:hypothetical protein HDU86_008109 [Geranomyces michiganensis]|nr:hypothetical protein HDU86_008109 [Geranomyces michiganensis]
MKFTGLLAAATFASSVHALPTASAPGPFVVFGDSLSDNGNFYAFTNRSYPPSPPYYGGRFSNGPTWIELVAEKYGAAMANLAWGGATSDSVLSPPVEVVPGFTIPSVKDQIQGFLGGKPLTAVQSTIDVALAAKNDMSKAFFVVWGGGNVRFSIRLPIVPNLPGESFAAHNNALSATVSSFRSANSKATVLFFDVNPVFDSVDTDPAFKNTTAPCLEVNKNDGTFKLCAEPDTYSQWDDVHPTAAVHRLVAKAAEALMENRGSEKCTVARA